MKNVSLSPERRDCPYCHKIQGLKYYKEWGENDAYYCNQCFRVSIFTGVDLFTPHNGEIIAYPLADDKPVARDDRELLARCVGFLTAIHSEIEDIAEETSEEIRDNNLTWLVFKSELVARINDFYKEVEIYRDLEKAIIDNR